MNFFYFLCLILATFIGFVACGQRPVHVAPIKKTTPYYHVIRSNLKALDGKINESIEDLLKAIDAYPQDAYLKYLAARRFAEVRQWDNASFYIQSSLKQKPDWAEAKLLWGEILESVGSGERASKIYREVVEKTPDNEQGYFKLAQNLVNQKKYGEAIQILQKWLTKKPDSILANYYIATIQNIYQKKPLFSIQTYKKILNLDPENIRVRHQIANIYLNQKKLRESLEQFLEIESRVPADLGIKLNIASIYYDLGEINKAITELQDILEINPNADRIHFFLGMIFEKQNSRPEALRYFANVPPVSGLYKDAVLHQASIYRDLKQNPDAISVLERGIHKRPDIPSFYQFLSLVWEEENKLEKALDILKQGITKIPEEEELYFNLGVLYDKLKDRESSIRAMRKVIKLNENNASALNYIGYVYAEKGEKLDEAESLIRQALKIKPDDGYIIDSLGWVYFQRGDLENAELHILKALKAVPTEPTINEHLGDIYLKRGKKKEALQYFQKALQYGQKKEKPNAEEIQRVEKKIQELST